MKKVWIGVGIGFAVVVLVGVVALVAGGFWLKGQVEGAAGDARALSEQLAKTEERATALNERFPFAAPPKGVPVAVTEGRLDEYLAVRAALGPVYRTYEEKAKALEASAGEKPGLRDAVRAMGTLSELFGAVRTAWLDQLEAKRMSPREFHAITAALYSSNWAVAIGEARRQERPALEGLKTSLETQLAAAEGELRAAIETQLVDVKDRLAALPAGTAPGEAERVHRANHELFLKHQTRIEEQAGHGLDIVLLGGDHGGLGEAFENVQVGDEND